MLTLFAGIGFVFATGGVIYFLNLWAFGLFVGITICGTIYWSVYQHFLARWWYAPTGPGSDEEIPVKSSERP